MAGQGARRGKWGKGNRPGDLQPVPKSDKQSHGAQARRAKGDGIMTDATLSMFRTIADEMIGRADWQWIGPHMSQRMFGITKERAEAFAKSHGGRAEPMKKGGE